MAWWLLGILVTAGRCTVDAMMQSLFGKPWHYAASRPSHCTPCCPALWPSDSQPPASTRHAPMMMWVEGGRGTDRTHSQFTTLPPISAENYSAFESCGFSGPRYKPELLTLGRRHRLEQDSDEHRCVLPSGAYEGCTTEDCTSEDCTAKDRTTEDCTPEDCTAADCTSEASTTEDCTS